MNRNDPEMSERKCFINILLQKSMMMEGLAMSADQSNKLCNKA